MSLQTRAELALDYASKGYYVHPLCWPTVDGRCACGRRHVGNEIGKAPLLPHGSDDATLDEDTIRAWWQQWPEANIGFNLEKSGLIDIAPDCREWTETFKTNGMPRTACYRSGSGWHTLYRQPADCPIYRSCKRGEYDLMSSGNAVAPGSAHRSGRLYFLVTDLPPVSALPEAPAWAVQLLRDAEQASATSDDLDMELVEKRRGNIDVILARITPTLPKMAREALEHPENCPSYSEARYRVIGGLMHLPNEEIAALIHYWADEGKLSWGHLEGKSQRQKNGDIVRCIGKHEARMQGRGYPRVISPTRGAGLLPAQPVTKPKARQDRPRRIDAAGLFAWYEQEAHSGAVLLSVGEVAAAHQVSARTIQRIERQLEAAGLIERKSKHHQSFVRLLRSRGDNIAAVSPLPIADPAVPEAENEVQPSCTNTLLVSGEDARESAHSGETLSPLPTTPAEWVAVYLDAYTEPPREVLNKKTGELRAILYVHTVDRFVRFVAEQSPGHPWPALQLRNVYRTVQKARRADYWRSERAKLKAMETTKLPAAIRARQRGLARNIGKKLEGRWRKRLELAEEEYVRRPPVTPEKRRPRRADTESVPVSLVPRTANMFAVGASP